jgi:hypothetical protein
MKYHTPLGSGIRDFLATLPAQFPNHARFYEVGQATEAPAALEISAEVNYSHLKPAILFVGGGDPAAAEVLL